MRASTGSAWLRKPKNARRMRQLQLQTDSLRHASDFGRPTWWLTQGLSAVLNGWIVYHSTDPIFRAVFVSCFVVFPLDQWGLFR